ncbi:MAG: hypothetical protein AB1393_12705 [Candidatus Edwardsbacteria bacterium]
MKLNYHPTLTEEKWATFSTSQQILMIANELNRAGNWIAKSDFSEAKLCYERAMELLFLTIATLKDHKKLRELLRFKEMLATLYAKDVLSNSENSSLLKALILLDKGSFQLLETV